METFATRVQTIAVYLETIERLARVEDVHLVLVGYPGPGLRSTPVWAGRQALFGAVAEAAAARRIPWVDMDLEFERRAIGDAAVLHDGLHLSDLAHEVMTGIVFDTLTSTVMRQ